jgi:hypothetical protein
MASIDPNTRIVPNPRAVYRKLAEGSGGVVLHLDTAAYHGVNETGALIWSTRELLEALREEFVGAPASLDDEVAAFLTDLEERNLLAFETSAAAEG